ncbi:MAG: sigma-54-dependent Fis family transcriptional regulator, partial [Acidobacteria bacterium]|nr:sigma-54-dependent Fis family transcriptional regulator [Acidobacteriota bacterium]
MVVALEIPEDFSMLVIGSDPSFADLMPEIFRDLPVKVIVAPDADSGLHIVKQRRPRMVFLDLQLNGTQSFHLLEQIVHFDPRIEVILLSQDNSPGTAVEAIQKGAAEYLVKPIVASALRDRVEQSIQFAQRKQQTHRVDAELLSFFHFHGMVGRSPRLLDVFNMIKRIAPHFRTVLISGPSGTGKELAARALHDLSPNRKGPFLVSNCASVPEALAESEWFGYAKGAFTG